MPDVAGWLLDGRPHAPVFDDLVDLVPGPTGEPAVQRRTCCLAFTLPQPKVCGGCCLR